MFSVKNRIGFWFGLTFFCLLFSTVLYAIDNQRMVSPAKDRTSCSLLPRNGNENLPLITGEKAYQPWRWDNDVLVAQGLNQGGFSTDYDESGNLYAVRCTTYNAHDSSGVRIYKSTDAGASWFVLNGFGDASGNTKFSYPVILSRNKLYVFYLTSSQNGDIGVARFSQDGTTDEGYYNVKADADTIIYFSVCTDDGSHLMVAYQKDEDAHNIHKVYTITSTDSGATWGNETQITDDGQHPDIAYGNNGHVYSVWESALKVSVKNWIPYYEIKFRNNTNYCAPGSWQGIQSLTDDDYDDHYPKVAALHTLPADTACVWVAYNHETSYAENDTLQYDDDTVKYYWSTPHPAGGNLFNVRFTPAGDYWLESVQFLFFHKVGTGAVRIYAWADTNGYPAQKIDSVDVPHDSIQLYPNWTTVRFLSKKSAMTVQSDFHIGYVPLGSSSTDTLSIISDNGEPAGTEHRSLDFYNGAWETMYSGWGYDFNFMIRAVVGRFTSTDLRFAYSTNSGTDWSKNHELANSSEYDEKAADLKAYRSSTNEYVDLCYLKAAIIRGTGWDICYTWTQASRPESFSTPPETINDHGPLLSPDSREVGQLTYPYSNYYPGIVYAGTPLLKDGGQNSYDGGWNLYYDYFDWMGVEEETAEEKLPAEFSLSNNYPNPFNPETKIDYSIVKVCRVKLEIFNILGQKIRTLVDEDQSLGNKSTNWDGRNENGEQVTSGVYFYRLQAGDYSQTKKMVLLK